MKHLHPRVTATALVIAVSALLSACYDTVSETPLFASGGDSCDGFAGRYLLLTEDRSQSTFRTSGRLILAQTQFGCDLRLEDMDGKTSPVIPSHIQTVDGGTTIIQVDGRGHDDLDTKVQYLAIEARSMMGFSGFALRRIQCDPEHEYGDCIVSTTSELSQRVRQLDDMLFIAVREL